MSEETWKLYYWPGFPGRGEFVRLLFEEAAVEYIDVGNLPEEQGGGIAPILKFIKGENEGFQVLAPPIITKGGVVLAQTANICSYLAPKLGLSPGDEVEAAQVNQISLTVMDFVNEVHDVHHPVAVSLTYEDQKPEAQRRGEYFLKERIPKFLSYFERVLQTNPKSKGEYLVGDSITFADLHLFHLLVGLEFAFPQNMKRISGSYPLVMALKNRVSNRPKIAAYLKSDRRQPFNNGIFRYYKELDKVINDDDDGS